jgi:hypothetical protein
MQKSNGVCDCPFLHNDARTWDSIFYFFDPFPPLETTKNIGPYNGCVNVHGVLSLEGSGNRVEFDNDYACTQFRKG